MTPQNYYYCTEDDDTAELLPEMPSAVPRSPVPEQVRSYLRRRQPCSLRHRSRYGGTIFTKNRLAAIGVDHGATGTTLPFVPPYHFAILAICARISIQINTLVTFAEQNWNFHRQVHKKLPHLVTIASR